MKDYLKKFKKGGVYTRFFITMFCLSIIPLILFSVINFTYISDTIIDHIHNSNRTMLDVNIKSIDEKISDLRDSTFVFALNCKDRFMNTDNTLTGELRYRMAETSNDIRDLVNSNSIIYNAFICFPGYDIVLAVDGQYSLEFYFNNICLYTDHDYDFWKEYLKINHRFEFLETDEVTNKNIDIKKNLITVCTTIYFSEESPIVMVIALEDTFMKDYLINMDIGDSGNIHVFDQNKVFISIPEGNNEDNDYTEIRDFIETQNSIEGDFLLNDKIITYVKSAFTHWSYVTAVSRHDILAKINNIKMATIIVCVLFFIIGLALSNLLSNNMYKPIMDIVSAIDNRQIISPSTLNKANKKNEYNYIYDKICSLYYSNSRLNQFIIENKIALQEKLLFDIQKGILTDKKKIDYRIDKFFLDLNYKYYLVIIFKIDIFRRFLGIHTEKELQTDCNSLFDKIRENLSRNLKVYRVNDNEGITSFVVMSNEADLKTKVKTRLYYIYKLFEGQYEYMKLTACLGNVYNNVVNLRLSYNEATECVDLRQMTEENQVIEYSKEHMQHYDMFNLVGHEKAIFNSMKTGEYNQAVILVNKVIDKNVHNGVPFKYIKTIVFEALGYCERLPYSKECFENKLKNQNIHFEVENIISAEEMKEYIADIFFVIGEYINENRSSDEEIAIEKISDFIEKNYNKDIYLDIVAEHAGMSTKYFSSFFSLHFGESFVKYLMQLRINKANELLANTKLKVKDIAQMVGYDNVNSFVRAYKRSEGRSPGKSRNIM